MADTAVVFIQWVTFQPRPAPQGGETLLKTLNRLSEIGYVRGCDDDNNHNKPLKVDHDEDRLFLDEP